MRVNTFTFGLLLTCAFASITVATSVDDVTKMLNGLATNVQGTIDTASIASCGSESIFAAFEAGFLPIMDEVASCNPLDFSDIASKISALMKAVPDSAKECAKNNADAKKLLTGLGINGLTPDQIKSKITTYVMDNLLSICGTFGDLDSKLKGGDFVGFGTEAGKIALEIFQSSSAEEIAQNIVFALMNTQMDFLADSSSLQQFAEGFVSQTSAAGTSVATFLSCLDDDVADTIVDGMTKFFAWVASGDIAHFDIGYQILQDAISKVPQDQITCVAKDANFQKILKAVEPGNSATQLTPSNIIDNLFDHLLELIMNGQTVNADFISKNFKQAGIDAANGWLKFIA